MVEEQCDPNSRNGRRFPISRTPFPTIGTPCRSTMWDFLRKHFDRLPGLDDDNDDEDDDD